MNFLFGSNKAFFGIIIVASVVIALMMVIAKGVVTYGLELMMAVFQIVQGVISKIMRTSGLGGASTTKLPKEMIKAIEDCGFFESIPLWAVTIIGSLFITILSFIIIMTVYGRFFKLYIYTAIAPTAMVWKYIGELVFNMLVLVGSVKMSDRIVREMMGL